MLETFTIDTFSEQIGSPFQIFPTAGDFCEATLLQVSPLRAKGPSGEELPRKRIPFSLIFRIPFPGRFEQKIYNMEHPVIGSFEIFLVPIGREADGYRCEAIFT